MQNNRVLGCVCPTAESINVILAPKVFIIRCQQDSKALNQITDITDITFLFVSLPKIN